MYWLDFAQVSLLPNLYPVRQNMVACIPKPCLGFVRHLVFPIQVLSTDNKTSTALCTNTIVAPENAGSYPMFAVTDLPNDDRYKDLPYVAGPPYFRYYAGTPLISKDGFRVGSLFVIDTRTLPTLTSSEISFLGIMARNIMEYLELQADHRYQHRQANMSRSLAALLEGEKLTSVPTDLPMNGTHLINGQLRPQETDAPSQASTPLPEPNDLDELTTSDPAPGIDHTRPLDSLFTRAATLLRQALDVKLTVFLELSQGGGSKSRYRSSAKVVASCYNTTTIQKISDDSIHLDNGILKMLCSQHPRGKMWEYEKDGRLRYEEEASPFSEAEYTFGPAEEYDAHSQHDVANILRTTFPTARQILFVPLPDNESFGQTGCFAVAEHEIPVFSMDSEVPFMRGFMNSFLALAGKITAKIGEQQKANFISSMSHVKPTNPATVASPLTFV